MPLGRGAKRHGNHLRGGGHREGYRAAYKPHREEETRG